MDKQQQFIESIAAHAEEVQRKYGVPASIAIAQAALESGWGDSVKGNNLFGVKAGKSWQGETVDIATHEYVNGKRVAVTDQFRAYDSVKDSLNNYGKLLATKSCYAGVIAADDANEAADALQRAGYATDPKYAEKLKKIIATYDLTRFDDESYRGYTADDRFDKTRRRLKEQREENPDIWADFIKDFFTHLVALFSGLCSALGFSDSKPESLMNLPRPEGAHPAAGRADARREM